MKPEYDHPIEVQCKIVVIRDWGVEEEGLTKVWPTDSEWQFGGGNNCWYSIIAQQGN